MPILVAFDYRCGYSYKAARYLRELRRLGESLEVEWVPFSLEQVNEEHGAGILLWEHDEIETGSFLGLAAGRWIEKSCPAEVFDSYHYAAFATMHEEERPLARKTILKLAKKAGADRSLLEEALDSGKAQRQAADDYLRLWNDHGVFGTPTFLFPSGNLYVRLRGVWTDDAHRVRVWEQIRALAAEPLVGEIKRVAPPEQEHPPAVPPL